MGAVCWDNLKQARTAKNISPYVGLFEPSHLSVRFVREVAYNRY